MNNRIGQPTGSNQARYSRQAAVPMRAMPSPMHHAYHRQTLNSGGFTAFPVSTNDATSPQLAPAGQNNSTPPFLQPDHDRSTFAQLSISGAGHSSEPPLGDVYPGARTQIPRTATAQPDSRFQPYPPEAAHSGNVIDINVANVPATSASSLQAVSDKSPTIVQWQHGKAPRRQRRTQACNFCHAKRARCEGGVPCNNCITQDVRCEWRKMKRRGPKPRKGKPGCVVPSQSAEKKAPSAADISNLLLSDHRVAIVNHLSPKQESASSPESNTQEYFELPETTSAHVSTLSFEVSSVGDLLDQFYSDKVCAETREAIITFFDIHYAKLPIFHPSTLIRSVVNHTANPLLIDAIKALSSYNMSGYTIDTEKLVTSVKSRILLCMDEEPSLEVMQAMVVMSLLEIFRERHYSLAALLNATIGLIIQLKWNEIDLYKTKEPETWADWVEMETKRRVFWAVFQFDNLVSITDGGHSTSIPESVIFVRAPCMDTEWNDIDFTDYAPKCRQPAEDTEPTDLASSTIVPKPLTETRTVVSGAMSHSYAKIIELGSNNCRIVRFLWDAKTGVYDRDRYGLSERPFPAANFLEKLPSKGILAYPIRRKARLISEYPEFQKYSDRLCKFYTQVQSPEQFMDRASEEGCLRNTMYGQFPVRVRYLVLQCFVCAVLILLHSSNRPSFFAEFDHPPEMQPESMSPDDLRKRLLLKKRFGATWSQSLLANDIEPESWRVCVEYAHRLARFIERNSDLPHTRITYASAQCLFIVSSVLLRQINICKTALGAGRDSQMSLEEWQEELERCVEETRVLWRKLQGFNLIWTTTGMTDMLLSMDIAKATATTEVHSTR